MNNTTKTDVTQLRNFPHTHTVPLSNLILPVEIFRFDRFGREPIPRFVGPSVCQSVGRSVGHNSLFRRLWSHCCSNIRHCPGPPARDCAFSFVPFDEKIQALFSRKILFIERLFILASTLKELIEQNQLQFYKIEVLYSHLFWIWKTLSLSQSFP